MYNLFIYIILNINEITMTIIEDSNLLGYCSVLTGRWFLIFQRSIVPPSSGSGSPRRLISCVLPQVVSKPEIVIVTSK
jgi:hypothetical protein